MILLPAYYAVKAFIGWLMKAQSFVTSSATPIAAQKLRLIDDNSQYQALERRNIRFFIVVVRLKKINEIMTGLSVSAVCNRRQCMYSGGRQMCLNRTRGWCSTKQAPT